MKKIFLFLLVAGVIAFPACNEKVKVASASDKDSTGKMESTAVTKAQQNKQTALSAMAAFNKGDLEAGFKDCVPGYLDYGDGSGKPMDLQSVKQLWKEFLNAFPDFKVDNIKCVADDEWAMVWADCSGTWKGPFMKQKANGKSFKMRDVDLFRINNEGKFVEHYNIQPFSVIAKQTGVKFQ